LENAGIINAERISLKNVKTGQQYIIVISTNSGLWAYRLNDIISFVCIDPFRICVSGRLEDIFSPFGEHLLTVQAERAIVEVCRKTNLSIVDFIILPDFNFEKGHRYLCYIEFENLLPNKNLFAKLLQEALCNENNNYEEFQRAGIIILPEIVPLPKNFFKEYLKNETVQQKTRHFSNDPELISTLNKLNKK
jgi:hypothetical protein